jgi:hypothetical protein
MNNFNKKPKGIIAIVSLLIIATIAMLFAVSMLMDGVKNASLSNGSISYENARINATACAEDVFMRIMKEAQFTRNLNYTFSPNNTCSTVITWFTETSVKTGLTQRLVNLDVTGVSAGFTRVFHYGLKVLKFDVNHLDGTLTHMNTINFISITEGT